MNKLTRQLRDENNELEKQLSVETNEILTDIVVYIRCANISEYEQERVRRDIYDMLLEGERRGQSVSDIIGDDYKAFCDSVISEVPQLTAAQKVLTVVSYAVMAMWASCSPSGRCLHRSEALRTTERGISSPSARRSSSKASPSS